MEKNKSCIEVRRAPMMLSAILIVCYSLVMSCLVAAPNHTVMEVDKTDPMTAV